MINNGMPSSMPNTNLTNLLLSEKVIICCGEDEKAVMTAFQATCVTRSLDQQEFRSYKIRKYTDFTLILTGMGTGCIEPLIYELLSFGIAKSLVLVGTAGCLPESAALRGEIYIIREAYLAGTGLDREVTNYPLIPNFHLVGDYKSASIVSTDFYYGFSTAQQSSKYNVKLAQLQRDVAEHVKKKIDLVDMEVGQFYALCSLMSDKSSVEYIAVKGPANALDKHEEQIPNTKEILSKAFRAAFDLLGIL
jgi:uridine phosphorylase